MRVIHVILFYAVNQLTYPIDLGWLLATVMLKSMTNFCFFVQVPTCCYMLYKMICMYTVYVYIIDIYIYIYTYTYIAQHTNVIHANRHVNVLYVYVYLYTHGLYD